jgi:tripartite-type tricarboxylate transporter receptor subunit TctC
LKQKEREENMTRKFAFLIFLFPALLVGNSLAQSNYPEKPVRIIAGFPAGSSADIVARLLGAKLAAALGGSVVVENVTGAAGNIAAERVAKAAPDGHTLALAVNAQLIINPSLYKLPYDTAKDFAPISQVYLAPNILVVHNGVPAKSIKELVALAKAQPGALTFASGGSGSSPHLAAELFKSMAGVDIRHIPYKGAVAGVPDLLGGRVTMMFIPIPVVMSQVREGKLRALAVTSLKRSPAAPDVPTVDEAGVPGYEVTLWGALLAPAGTPAAIVRRLHRETVASLALPDLRAKFADLGLEPVGGSPDQLATVIKSEIPQWAQLITASGIRAD